MELVHPCSIFQHNSVCRLLSGIFHLTITVSQLHSQQLLAFKVTTPQPAFDTVPRSSIRARLGFEAIKASTGKLGSPGFGLHLGT